MSIVKKYALVGAAIMLVVSALGSILGPSPLNILFAPIMMVTTAPLRWAIFVIPGLDAIAAGGLFGVEGAFMNYRFFEMLVGWNVFIGAALGTMVGMMKQTKSP